MGAVVGGWMGFGSCNVAVYGYEYSCPVLLEPEPVPGPVVKGDKIPGLISPEKAWLVLVLALVLLPEYPKP